MRKFFIIQILFVLILCSSALAESGVSGHTEARVDDDTQAMFVISPTHGYVHDGSMWEVSHFTEDLADDATLSVYLSVPSGLYAVVMANGGCEGDANTYIFSGCTVSSGTEMTEYNRKILVGSEALTVSSVQATLNPTLVSNGDTRYKGFIYGGDGVRSVGATAIDVHERMYGGNQGVTYALVNRAGSAKDANIELNWYYIAED